MILNKKSKVQLSIVVFGVIIGIVGILHGISEILQGSIMVNSNMVKALPENWPNVDFYQVMEGQPAFTILTDIPFSLLGILAIIISSMLIIHCLFFLQRKHGLLIFALLNLGVALFGAGVGTPITMGVPLVIFGLLTARSKSTKNRSESSIKLNLILFKVFFGLQVFSWVLFCPGLVIVSSFGKIPEPLFLFDFMIMPISIVAALIFGYRHDNSLKAN